MKNAVVGQTLTGANGSTAIVKAVTDTTLTLDIQNIDNPFYKKTVKVGAVADTPTATFKILKLSGTGVTLEVTNKQSPFYGKKFAAGESITGPQGTTTIQSIDGDQVTIAQSSPLVGKTLFFDVEILDLQ